MAIDIEAFKEHLEQEQLGAEGAGMFGAERPALRWPFGKLKEHQRDLAAHQELDRLLVASDYMRRELIRAGCEPSRVERVGYFTRQGQDATPKSPLPEELTASLTSSDAPLILCSARLVHPDKGVDFLLTALGELKLPWRCVKETSTWTVLWAVSPGWARGSRER